MVLELKYPTEFDGEARRIVGWPPFSVGGYSKYVAAVRETAIASVF